MNKGWTEDRTRHSWDNGQYNAARPISEWQFRVALRERQEARRAALRKAAFWTLVVLACVGVWALLVLAITALG